MKGIQSNGFLPIIAQAIAEMEELHGEFAGINEINLAELGRRTGISRAKLRRLKANGFCETPHGLIGQRLLNAVLDLLGGLLQLHGAQLGDHSLRLLAGRLFALLGVDRLEHFCHNFDLGFGHNRENVAVEMYRAALVFGVREHLAHGLQHSHTLVADDELYAVQAASTKPLEETDPAGLVLLHALFLRPRNCTFGAPILNCTAVLSIRIVENS